MKILSIFLFGFVSVISLTHSSLAAEPHLKRGGMSGGGGGEIIDDFHNPWFVENTQAITYCIKIDQSSFSADSATIAKVVTNSIQQWNHEFTSYQARHTSTPLKLATQTWIAVDCSGPVDITFQFGWGTLDSKQIEELSDDGDPHKYIAVAWRTDYDQTQLKGKGYVFVGSDLGENAFDTGVDQIDRPWQYAGLLELEVLHELGHVFGLPHLSPKILGFTSRWLMSEAFPEVLLRQWLWPQGPPQLDDDSVSGAIDFFDPTNFQKCFDVTTPQGKAIADWFGTPASTACLIFNLTINEAQVTSFNFQTVDTANHIGTPVPIAIDQSSLTGLPDIELYLNPQQKVFPAPRASYLPYVAGPAGHSGQFTGHYKAPNGKSLAFLATFDVDYSLKIIVSDPTSGNIVELLDTDPLVTPNGVLNHLAGHSVR